MGDFGMESSSQDARTLFLLSPLGVTRHACGSFPKRPSPQGAPVDTLIIPKMHRFLLMVLALLAASLFPDGMSLSAATPTEGAAVPSPSPEKDAGLIPDPEALRREIPCLASQDSWTNHATADEIALFKGPVTEWKFIPAGEYDLKGFATGILGSKLPPPGVHPRLLFSPEDVPSIAKGIASSPETSERLRATEQVLNRSIWNPASDEGKVFRKLATGDLRELEWPADEGAAPGFKNTHYFKGYRQQMAGSVHTGYLPPMLQSAAFLCLLRNDGEKGREVATAIANYYRLREPLIDRLNGHYDREKITPKDYWRPMHQLVAGLCYSYDFAAPWMNEEQKSLMRRVISKATSGKRGYGMSAPVRWRDTNWVAWDLVLFLTAMSIEGEEGYDPAIYPVALETARAYLDWGISPSGTIFETNGKNGAITYELESLVCLARHGDNLIGHPHLRRLAAAQCQTVVPAGGHSVDNGTWGCQLLGANRSAILSAFYPDDPCAAFLFRQARPDSSSSANAHASPDIFFMEGARAMLFEALATRSDNPRERLGLPLAFVDPVHGLLTARSGNGTNALFLHFEARPDLRGVGHQHHDSGHFYLGALGEMWAVEAGPKNSFSPDHNTVLIDGTGHNDAAFASRVGYLGAVTNKEAAFASADLANAYNYSWTTPMHPSWMAPERVNGTWKVSPDTDPELVAYCRGTERFKTRLWGGSHWDQNWGPIMRIAGNPVRYAFRSAGITRGEHPWALIVDDIAKDDGSHLYQWLMQVPEGTRIANIPLADDAVPGVVLTKAPAEPWQYDKAENLPPNTPCLLLFLLRPAESPGGPSHLANQVADARLPIRLEQIASPKQIGSKSVKNRLIVEARAVDPAFRILLFPWRSGEPMPQVRWNEPKKAASIAWKGQTDEIIFSKGEDHRTRFTITRGGLEILKSL